MSLRRSSRVPKPAVSQEVPVPIPKQATKYEKLANPSAAAASASAAATTTTKKRKTRNSTTNLTGSPIAKRDPEDSFIIPSLPGTPLPKRRRATAPLSNTSPCKPAPVTPTLTPTPSGVGLIITSSREGNHPLDSLPLLRAASPAATNAPLSTPGGSNVVALSCSPIKPEDPSPVKKKKKAKEAVAPDMGVKTGGGQEGAERNVETVLKEAEEHLIAVDEKLRGLVEKHKCEVFSPKGLREVVDPFTALASSIMGQQVSGAAAASIKKKFTDLFPETHPSFPSPSAVIQKDLPTLRTAGLSQRKAEYICGLAEKFHNGELTAQMLISASDEELIEKLVAVRGLGRWSVEMFACFGLKRMDVFSTGDLGVQRGMATYMGRDTSKLKNNGGKWKYMSEQEMLDIASSFSPYRSLFMWYMWRIEHVDIGVMQST